MREKIVEIIRRQQDIATSQRDQTDAVWAINPWECADAIARYHKWEGE